MNAQRNTKRLAKAACCTSAWLLALASPALALTTSLDYTSYLVTGNDSNQVPIQVLHGRLTGAGYHRYEGVTSAPEQVKLGKGDVVFVGQKLSGMANEQGRIQYLLRLPGSQASVVYPIRATSLPEYRPDDTLAAFLQAASGAPQQSPAAPAAMDADIAAPPSSGSGYNGTPYEIWRKQPSTLPDIQGSYRHGEKVGGPAPISAKANYPEDTGILLKKGEKYVVEAQGTFSAWGEMTDCLDAVFLLRSPKSPSMASPLFRDSFQLFDPDVSFSLLCKKQNAGKPACTPDHRYEVVVEGTGQTLKAALTDKMNKADNTGNMTLTVYKAVAK